MSGHNKIQLRDAALAAELVENEGLTLRNAEERTGIDHSTIWKIVHQHGHWGEIAELPVFKRHRETQNKTLEAAFRAGAALSLQEAYKSEKLDKASHYQLVLAASIATDKARLLAGEVTEIAAVLHVHEIADQAGILEKLAEVLKK